MVINHPAKAVVLLFVGCAHCTAWCKEPLQAFCCVGRSLTPKKKIKPQNGCSRLGVATLLPRVPWTLAFLHKHTNVEHSDSGIAVHPYTGIHMWISWTLGLQSIAQTCRPTGNNFRLFTPTSFVINRSGVHNRE